MSQLGTARSLGPPKQPAAVGASRPACSHGRPRASHDATRRACFYVWDTTRCAGGCCWGQGLRGMGQACRHRRALSSPWGAEARPRRPCRRRSGSGAAPMMGQGSISTPRCRSGRSRELHRQPARCPNAPPSQPPRSRRKPAGPARGPSPRAQPSRGQSAPPGADIRTYCAAKGLFLRLCGTHRETPAEREALEGLGWWSDSSDRISRAPRGYRGPTSKVAQSKYTHRLCR